MKKTLYFAFFLSVTSMLVTAVAYFAYDLTEPIIAQNRIDKITDTIEILFSAEDGFVRNPDQEENTYLEKNYDLISQVYEVIDEDEKLYSLIYDISAQGRNGIVEVLIAVDPYTDTIMAVTYYNHIETPNIGEKYTRNEEKIKLIGQVIGEVEVDAITGATTTLGAIESIFAEIETHYQQEEVHIDG